MNSSNKEIIQTHLTIKRIWVYTMVSHLELQLAEVGVQCHTKA